MTDKKILKSIAEYCSGGNVDLDTLNKISETVSLAAQKKKGKLSEFQEGIYRDALEKWANGNGTPREFKGQFRGEK